jgi:hypothetical protein
MPITDREQQINYIRMFRELISKGTIDASRWSGFLDNIESDLSTLPPGLKDDALGRLGVIRSREYHMKDGPMWFREYATAAIDDLLEFLESL